MVDSNTVLECFNKLPEIEDRASPNYPCGMCKKCLENSLDGSKEKSYTTNTKETQMLNKLKNWIQARRDKKKQAQVDEQAKRYPTNPFTDSSYSTYSTNIGGEETNGNRITSVDDVPEVYTPVERAALSDDSVSSSSSYSGSSYASDSSSSSSSYDSSSSSSSSCDSGSSSCSCGD